MLCKEKDQLYLTFPKPTNHPGLSPEVGQRCRELVGQMLLQIVTRELKPDEVENEPEDSINAS